MNPTFKVFGDIVNTMYGGSPLLYCTKYSIIFTTATTPTAIYVYNVFPFPFQ